MRNRANRASKLFRKSLELHSEGCSLNNEKTKKKKEEAEKKMKEAVRELAIANEIGQQINSERPNKDLELVKNGFRLAC